MDLIGGAQNAKTLPYLAVIRAKLPDIPIGPIGPELPTRRQPLLRHLQEKLTNPCLLELIWSYWHEEGMLVQTMNAITRRFQNVRGPMDARPAGQSGDRSAAAAQQPASGATSQDEQHRLSVDAAQLRVRPPLRPAAGRQGGARTMRTADTRSKFLEAFHNLLRLCTVFFKQDDDTTVKADAFPVLNALKEVHLILSQGAHNQFGDLPSTARIEMLMQQWLLARPEFREFLPTRIMVAYPEPWMDRVDAMKKLQGWTDTSVLHFRNLGDLRRADPAVRSATAVERCHRAHCRHSTGRASGARRSRATSMPTGRRRASNSRPRPCDAEVDATLPSVLLQQRLAAQQRIGMRACHARLHLRALSRAAAPERRRAALGRADARASGRPAGAAGRGARPRGARRLARV